MPEDQELVPIGRALKAHGLKGEIRIDVDEAYWDDFEELEVIFIPLKNIPAPFFIESMRGSFPAVIVKFEELDSRDDILMLQHKEVLARGSALSAPAKAADTEDNLLALTGYQAIDTHDGVLGPIVAVVEYPHQMLAEVDYQGRIVLIPLVPAFIRHIDSAQQQIHFDLPEGLLD